MPLTVFLTAGAGGTGIDGTAGLSTISFAFAFAIFAAVYSIGHISGCHINPAVTISLLATRKIDGRTAGGYIVAQLVGAFIGAGLTLIILTGNDPAKLGLGAVSVNANAGLADRLRRRGHRHGDPRVHGLRRRGLGQGARRASPGLIIGFIVYGIIILVGPITGASLNPARELGPALLGQAIGADPVPVEQLHRRLHLRLDHRRRGRRVPVRVHRARSDRSGTGLGRRQRAAPRARAPDRRNDPDSPATTSKEDPTTWPRMRPAG